MLINGVLGPLDTKDLGITFIHEHLVAASRDMCFAFDDWFDEDEVVSTFADLMEKQKSDNGLKTFVEASPINLGRDINLMRKAAEKANIQMLACTGLYWMEDPWFLMIDPEKLAKYYIRDITKGIQGTDIKAAFVKCSTDMQYGESDANKAMIEACAIASKETGVPVYTHTNGKFKQGLYQQEILTEKGVAAHKIAIGHAFGNTDREYLKSIMNNGSYVSCDQISYNEMICVTPELASCVADLCKEGYAQYIFLSHDKNVYTDYGFCLTDMRRDRQNNPITGSYTEVFEEMIPLLKQKGVSDIYIEDMMLNNPRRYFEGVAPQKYSL